MLGIRFLLQFVEQLADFLGFPSLQVALFPIRMRQPKRLFHQLIVFLFKTLLVIA